MYYGSSLLPVEGDATVVTARSSEFLVTANAILAAASDLLAVKNEQLTISEAVDTVRDLADQVHTEISEAESRYRAAALALQDFAPVLADAQQRATTAMDSYYPQQTKVDQLYNSFVYYAGDEPDGEETARLAWVTAQSALAGIRDDYDRAVADLKAASDAAAEKIQATIKGSSLNDSFWDNVSGLAEQLGQWFADVFGPFVDGLLDALGKIVQVLALVLGALLLLAVLLSPLFLIDVGLYVLLGNEAALDEALAMVVFALSPMIGAAWLTGRGTPTVTPLDVIGPQDVGTDDRPSPFASAVGDQAIIDGAGSAGVLGDDSAVVQVAVVVGEDGVTRYRVQIPSTQQWFAAGGAAPNDLDGNLWAKFFPGQRSELEKSVELALLEAGYVPGSGAPVMLAGFSQGGIAAANLTTDADFMNRFAVETVYTVGSPIGDVAIPADVSVLAIEHESDPVPHADFLTDNPESWITIREAPADPNPAVMGHNTRDYRETAGRAVDNSTDSEVVEFRESQDGFFYGTETAYQYEVRRG